MESIPEIWCVRSFGVGLTESVLVALVDRIEFNERRSHWTPDAACKGVGPKILDHQHQIQPGLTDDQLTAQAQRRPAADIILLLAAPLGAVAAIGRLRNSVRVLICRPDRCGRAGIQRTIELHPTRNAAKVVVGVRAQPRQIAIGSIGILKSRMRNFVDPL